MIIIWPWDQSSGPDMIIYIFILYFLYVDSTHDAGKSQFLHRLSIFDQY